MPDLRHWRTKGRSYTVPWVEVVVDATDHTFEEVRHSVTGVLTGSSQRCPGRRRRSLVAADGRTPAPLLGTRT